MAPSWPGGVVARIADPCAGVEFRSATGHRPCLLQARSRRLGGAPADPSVAGRTARVRLIHGESDGLPGVIADRYGKVVALQHQRRRRQVARGDRRRHRPTTACEAVFERSDSEVRGREGLEPVTGCVYGVLPDEALTIVENGVRMEVDVVGGHKTGFYLDQRDNRLLTGQLAAGRDVLNCFCYSGGFSLQALAGGARSVVSIDSSRRRWRARRATWHSIRSSMPAVPSGARMTCSRPCAAFAKQGAAST